MPACLSKSDSPLVCANYYPWWDQQKWAEGVTDTPTLGKYESNDPEIISQHLAWAAQAGIDCFVVEWCGKPGSPTDRVFQKMISFEDTRGIDFCIFYDSAINLTPKWECRSSQDFDAPFDEGRTKGQKFLDDMAHISRYFESPNYLKLNGKPVVYFYPVAGWSGDNLEAIMEEYDSSYKTYDVADVMGWLPDDVSQQNWNFWSKHFEAITGGIMHCEECIQDPQRDQFFPSEIQRRIAEYREEALKHDMGFIPPVIVGYDDRWNTPIPRESGDTLRQSWGIAMDNLDGVHNMVNIQTFNEWHEGSEIEPSMEYGTFYLDLLSGLVGQ
ncbi:MAG: glycoside hydrolase family 99-like domain-containing protein [Dehalococcoidia bacterium]